MEFDKNWLNLKWGCVEKAKPESFGTEILGDLQKVELTLHMVGFL